MTKNKMEEKTIILIRKVTASGHVGVPKFLVGKEVKVTFTRKMTEEEQKMLELNNLYMELKKIREKRRRKT